MKLAGVVVLYNPSVDNIKFINTYVDEVDKLYVVDNSDDNIKRLNSTDKIEYVKLNKNMGIAHALNVGAKRAIKDKFKYLLTLDQDSKITKKNIKDMKSFIGKTKLKKIGLVSPYQDIDSGDKLPEDEYTDIIEIMTSGNIIYLNAYQEIGGFKDWLFIDAVDLEYCLNLHKHGYKVLRLNNVIMKHNLGNYSIHKFLGKDYRCSNHNATRRYYMVRNNLYVRDMYHDMFPEYTDWLIGVQKGQAKRVFMFEKNKFKKLRYMYKGYNDYKKGIQGKLK
ncbi:MAG: glycosyltransferase family 2 protein [Firmicutes bacterium]|nr:glycosyltransferase family 2 protein [Bacillota bacterium]